ncbi:MFS transporter [Rhodococcus opacus]|uniref:MFS transporter n=1 Tax=Rhodococcus opacus TaxID=37919 RepID=UPI0002DDA3DC|nr:MFS transporter [Rhodococcus opacus]AHK36181.1 Shikimate transporter [Rhodococcus opacus PD630]UDH01218.1 MHS family MFS transporter [Rhodococcus opacus PD630]
MTNVSTNRAVHAAAPPRQARQVLLSSLLGTTIEYYEFFVYGIAASLVFGKLFFPSFDPLMGTLLSLATFGVGFVARPVGGLIFGHFGDRLGRKRMLVTSLLMMGTATFAIGALPSYAAIGVWAPILLVLARIVQGISLGGEYSGAVLMSVEHAGAKRRGLFGSIVGTGSGWGLLLANLAFLLVSQLDDAAFLAWGWRIPFLFSAVLVVIGLVIRIQLDESPEFTAVRASDSVHRFPLAVIARGHWRQVLLIAAGMISAGVVFYVSTVFSLAYGQQELGLSRSLMLTLVLFANVILIVGMPCFGWLSDRIGRRTIFTVSLVALIPAPFAWFLLLNTAQPALMILGFVVLFVPFVANFGIMPAYFAEMFPADVRFAGVAVSNTLGQVLGSSTAPLIAAALLSSYQSWTAVALYMALAGLISLTAAIVLQIRAADTRF